MSKNGLNRWLGFCVGVIYGYLVYAKHVDVFLGLLFVVVGTTVTRWLGQLKRNNE